ncbi:MAG TPA: NAD(P)(+) transhydrogenase (Re/Si-specific) subunit beta, partial [Thermoleophilia bacterium]|nr:NAD(P)(+) transhydrogenase (Re/Si-specific) subunit beta [Thermoleophilia bacterium]
MGDWKNLLVELAIIAILIVGIAQFRSPRGARRGNYVAALALALALAVVFIREGLNLPAVVIPSLAAGAMVGWLVAARVSMIQIPALVAFQHGMGGVAAFLVAFVELTRDSAGLSVTATISGYVGLIVGSATFAGSMIAAGKLANRLDQRPTVYRRHNAILVLILLVGTGLVLGAVFSAGAVQSALIVAVIASAMVLGVVFSIRIGGADMPVLISFLNATAGLAAAFVGVVIESRLLIAAGATVCSSGSILTYVMCTSMNRSLMNVLIGQRAARGGRGAEVAKTAPASAAATSSAEAAPVAAADPHRRALDALRAARSVIIVPGYGMAQAHAQSEVARLAGLLEKQGKQVRFAVHPVAGRMPGHMHVLLAEAEVEYDKLFEMKDINDDFADTDVVLVVGACDVVNPAAITREGTPISGMPILRAHEAGTVIVCNLDEKPGYSGVDNPLYDDPKAVLLFGDAKATIEGLTAGLEAVATSAAATSSVATSAAATSSAEAAPVAAADP